jgi:hypothetical protein
MPKVGLSGAQSGAHHITIDKLKNMHWAKI